MMFNVRFGVNLSATIHVRYGKSNFDNLQTILYKYYFTISPLCLILLQSDAKTSCDWSSCYDDVGFLEFLIERIGSRWCLDLDSIHLSGISNGGMFAYFLAAMSDDGIGKKIIFWQVF